VERIFERQTSRKRTDTVGELIYAASAAKYEIRVAANGLPASHAAILSRLMATAVTTCCKWVFANGNGLYL
jgi:hypothetical protein